MKDTKPPRGLAIFLSEMPSRPKITTLERPRQVSPMYFSLVPCYLRRIEQ